MSEMSWKLWERDPRKDSTKTAVNQWVLENVKQGGEERKGRIAINQKKGRKNAEKQKNDQRSNNDDATSSQTSKLH